MYGTEEQCFDALCRCRWPNGFSCSHCGHDKHCEIAYRKLKQCDRCRRQTSMTSRTIFDSTKLPLTTWFLGIFLITQDKQGISCMELARHRGISYNAAWRIKQKLVQVMMERDQGYKLSGIIELDDAHLGGERTGYKPGRGAKGKTPFVAAVETTKEGPPTRIKLSIIKGFRRSEISTWSKKYLFSGSTVISDSLPCFSAITEAGCVHDKIVCGGRRAFAEEPEFYWVNTVLGNLKSALRSSYHTIRPKYVQRYLAEFQYRFNRRFNLSALIPRLVYVSLRTPPMPEKLLKIRLA
ncbi:IS1595 family transposase [Microbulbifer sp. OS29]|uniref:IS1595 family transposase n=1 Tax=Microbulbifer okhotskensis TaxID=2926617 RepID=A0A9X2ERY8_9GAMM|nr:IS1595 family transposase [Microbulbifer okhotskensis]MCO1334641.1 IS1595 family transposase [Microbulbifer okhotskensis]